MESEMSLGQNLDDEMILIEAEFAKAAATGFAEAEDDMFMNRPRWQIAVRKFVRKIRRLLP